MRLRLGLGWVVLLVVGCAGPHSTGALWAQQNVEQELALFRLTDAQRADQGRAFELGLADADLATERARVEAGLADCPGGAPQPLALSSGDGLRDTIRIRFVGDSARLMKVAQVALADWRLRRARATGEARFCDGARQALAGSIGDVRPSSADPLAGMGSTLVSRDPAYAQSSMPDWSTNAILSNYALGYVDTVRADSPLPQYLAAVYGGQLVQRPASPDLSGRTPEGVVDDLAPAHPEWEPDALYQALLPG